MITPEQLRAMTVEDRADLMARLATAYYGTDLFSARLAEDMGVAISTPYRWAKNGPDFAVIFALDAWVNGPAMDRNLLEDWRDVPAQLAASAKAMAQAAEGMARIARRLPQITTSASPKEPLAQDSSGALGGE